MAPVYLPLPRTFYEYCVLASNPRYMTRTRLLRRERARVVRSLTRYGLRCELLGAGLVSEQRTRLARTLRAIRAATRRQ